MLLQMVGRPQYDDTGVAIIELMTRREITVELYLNLEQSPIESKLHLSLPEHLVLQTIRDVAGTVSWSRSTFMYQQMVEVPSFYSTA